MHYVARGSDLRRGERVPAMMFPAAELGTMLQGLECCWLGQFGQYDEPMVCQALSGYTNRAREHGFAWALAECLSVIGQPDLEMAEGRTRPAAAYREEADALHTRLGTRSLATLLAPMAEWEYPLKALEELAHEARSKPDAAKKRGSSTRRRRLAWQLGEDEFGEFAAKPREQLQSRNGAWSAGKPVSLKRLATSAASMDFLLEQDRAAAAKIRQTHEWGGRHRYYLDGSGLFELAGHPHVFGEAGAPVEVVRVETELVVDEHEGGLLAQLVPDAPDSGDYHMRVVDDRRCEVTRFTRGHKRLRSIIPEGGLELPAAARERLLDAVSALASEVRVHGGIAGGADTARAVEADPRTRVRLEPSGAGLAAELVVEPVPGSGTWFEPGAGGATVFASRDGEAVQARRDLPAERAAAETLVAACPALAGTAAAPPPWVFPEPSDALELLEQLHTAKAPCLWPKGEPFRIVARAATSNLSLRIRSAEEWFGASGTLAVDEGRVLDLKELFALLDASPHSRFLELGDGEFIALTASFRRHLDDLRSLSAPAARGQVRMPAMAAHALRAFAERTTLDADAGWRTHEERLRDAGAFEPAVPSTLQAELRPYQRDGFRWLARLARWGAGACLADDMGLGKTVQTLALLLDRAPEGPALVVAPTSVVANWLDEARRFAPTLNAVALHRGGVFARAADREGRTLRRARHHVRAAPERRRGALGRRLAQRRARRGPGHQEPRDPARPRGAGPQGRLSPGDHRHPDPEQPDGPLLAVRLRESRNARLDGALPAPLRAARRARRGRHGAGAASPPHRTLRAQAAEERGARRPAAADRDHPARRDVPGRGRALRGAAPARGGGSRSDDGQGPGGRRRPAGDPRAPDPPAARVLQPAVGAGRGGAGRGGAGRGGAGQLQARHLRRNPGRACSRAATRCSSSRSSSCT